MNIPSNSLPSLIAAYRSEARGGTHINSAPVITELGDARARMNARLDEVIPKRYRNSRVEHPEIQAWVDEYLQDPADARSLLIMGNVGTGKTWAGYGALRMAAVMGVKPNRAGRYILGTWVATTFPDFIAQTRPGAYTGTKDELNSEKYMLQLRETPLLLLDDLGVGKATDWTEGETHRLVSGRYDDEKPTIYTTNLTPKELDHVLGARMVSRLVEECVRVNLVGEDRRRAK